jgi:hypothetical protein
MKSHLGNSRVKGGKILGMIGAQLIELKYKHRWSFVA